MPLFPRNRYPSVIISIDVARTSYRYDELKTELTSSELADTVEGADDMLIHFEQQKESTIDASANTIQEGQTLLKHLKDYGCAGIGPGSVCSDDGVVPAGQDDCETGSNSGGGSKAVANSTSCVEGMLQQLQSHVAQLEELWLERRLKLDLTLQLRLFERDAMEVSNQLEIWAEELNRVELSGDASAAQEALNIHNESVAHLQSITFDVLQKVGGGY